MLPFVTMILMVGILAGAIAREYAPQPHPLGDIGPWLFGLAGGAIGAVVGLTLAGGEVTDNTDQGVALLGCVLGALAGAAAFLALASGRHRSVVDNTDTRQRSTPVSGARDPRTGASHGS